MSDAKDDFDTELYLHICAGEFFQTTGERMKPQLIDDIVDVLSNVLRGPDGFIPLHTPGGRGGDAACYFSIEVFEFFANVASLR